MQICTYGNVVVLEKLQMIRMLLVKVMPDMLCQDPEDPDGYGECHKSRFPAVNISHSLGKTTRLSTCTGVLLAYCTQ
jgi:hypothetical protein